MAQCKAITENGVQCKREARDGLEFCAIPAHAEQETMRTAVLAITGKDQYKIMILSVGAKSQPAIGGYSGQDVVALLQKYHDSGYDLFAVNDGGLQELAGSSAKDYFSVMYTFKLRE